MPTLTQTKRIAHPAKFARKDTRTRVYRALYGSPSQQGGYNMDDRTLRALQGSIAKWQAIVQGIGTDEGCTNCPLCIEFFDTTGETDDGEVQVDECFECPVFKFTGETGCEGTPHSAAWDALGGRGKLANTPAKVAAARAELEFLQSLLPPTTQHAQD